MPERESLEPIAIHDLEKLKIKLNWRRRWEN